MLDCPVHTIVFYAKSTRDVDWYEGLTSLDLSVHFFKDLLLFCRGWWDQKQSGWVSLKVVLQSLDQACINDAGVCGSVLTIEVIIAQGTAVRLLRGSQLGKAFLNGLGTRHNGLILYYANRGLALSHWTETRRLLVIAHTIIESFFISILDVNSLVMTLIVIILTCERSLA